MNEAFARIVAGEPLDAFCIWFAAAMGAAVTPAGELSAAEADWIRRSQIALARWLWGHVPVPQNQWRPRTLTQPGRNAPCYCGSGRKYKHCCREFSDMEPPLDPPALLGMALDNVDAAALAPEQLCRLPAPALAMAADGWNDSGRAQRTVDLLEPLFLQHLAELNADHELVLDILATAMLELHLERRRNALLEHVSQSRVLALATTARARLVAMLSDHGDYDAAWALFQKTRRLAPRDPQLWSLELTLLLGQGRKDEARLRAPLLAAQARKTQMPELAQALLALADGTLDMGHGGRDDTELLAEPLAQLWLALGEAVPAETPASAWRALYKVDTLDTAPGAQAAAAAAPSCILEPRHPLQALQRRWQQRWRVVKPDLTWLTTADDGELLDDGEQLMAFLDENPQAWLSFDVIDDLVLAGAELTFHDVPDALLAATQKLLDHAVAGLRALLTEDGTLLPWGFMENRAALRLLAHAVELAGVRNNRHEQMELLQWGLAINPHDNHGWRHLLVERLLQESDFEQTLQWLDRYPDDMSPSEHHRALALFATGRRDEAATALRAAHERAPRFMAALWPDIMDPPEPEGDPTFGILVGGAEAAYDHRVALRAVWVSLGALDWARQLKLPPAARILREQERQRAQARTARPPGKTIPFGRLRAPPFGQARAQRLARYLDYARVQGFMTAIAWSPEPVQPSQWLHAASALIRHDADTPEAVLDSAQVQEITDLLVQLFNRLNFDVMRDAPDARPPLPLLGQLPLATPGVANRWAAGFVEGAELSRGNWHRAGSPVKVGHGAFGVLLELAAQAAPSPSGWRASGVPDQPLLVGLEAQAPEPAARLRQALNALWQGIAAQRQGPPPQF